jgi:hypothetical protein
VASLRPAARVESETQPDFIRPNPLQLPGTTLRGNGFEGKWFQEPFPPRGLSRGLTVVAPETHSFAVRQPGVPSMFDSLEVKVLYPT